MSIFGNIVSAIFKHGTAAATTAGPSASAAKGAASGAPGITGKPLTQDQVEDMIKKIADAQTAVELEQLHEIDDRFLPIVFFILRVCDFLDHVFDLILRERLAGYPRCSRSSSLGGRS